MNDECCDEPSEVCTGGYPVGCNAGCSAQLLPFQRACATFLATPAMAEVKTIIDSAAAKCGH